MWLRGRQRSSGGQHSLHHGGEVGLLHLFLFVPTILMSSFFVTFICDIRDRVSGGPASVPTLQLLTVEVGAFVDHFQHASSLFLFLSGYAEVQ